MRTARALSRTAAGLLALCVGSGDLLAAAPPDTIVPEKRLVVEKIAEKLGEKIDKKIDEAVGEKTVAKIEEVHENQELLFGEFFGKIDRVFGEQYTEDRERKIQAGLGLETTFNDDGNSIDTKLHIGLRVPLPALDRRINGFVSFGGDASEIGAVSNPKFSESERNFSLGASLLRRFRDDLEAGVRVKLLSSGTIFLLYPFVRIEEKVHSMRYFFEQKIMWQSDNTWRSLTDFDVDRRFDFGLFLRLRNRVDYSFEEPGASIAHGLIVRRGFMDTSGLSLEFWLEYNTASDNPAKIEDDTITYAQLRLRGRIWRKWVEYELRPIYTIPIDTDRSSFFGFFISLAVIWDSYLGGGAIPDADLDR